VLRWTPRPYFPLILRYERTRFTARAADSIISRASHFSALDVFCELSAPPDIHVKEAHQGKSPVPWVSLCALWYLPHPHLRVCHFPFRYKYAQSSVPPTRKSTPARVMVSASRLERLIRLVQADLDVR
jgi:hypothetical protein